MLKVELQQEGPPPSIVDKTTCHLVPLVVGEAGDGLAELGADDGEGVLEVVAVLVESSNLEVMLRGSE